MQKLAQLLRSSALLRRSEVNCRPQVRLGLSMPALGPGAIRPCQPTSGPSSCLAAGASRSHCRAVISPGSGSTVSSSGSRFMTTLAMRWWVLPGPSFGSHGRTVSAPFGARSVMTMKRNRMRMKMHRYLKNVKRVKYVSCIPQYAGPLGRQTKKRAFIKSYRKCPRLRQFKRER
mmetsp:Transcript_30692/g.56080  ORF Transcript_30692/g.56080 Transcript_30692/m.56080 type:complete len:174 (+) Transcript_30692:109-630(+)